jgi:hypothetical protein
MENLGKRVRLRPTAASSGDVRHHAGKRGTIEQFARDPETLELLRYSVRLDGEVTQLDLEPGEVEILDD